MKSRRMLIGSSVTPRTLRFGQALALSIVLLCLCASTSFAEDELSAQPPETVHQKDPADIPDQTDPDHADESTKTSADEGGVSWDIFGQYRFWMEGRSGFPLDSDGAQLEDATFGYQIAEIGGELEVDWFKARIAARALSGRLFGDHPCTEGETGCIVPGAISYDRGREAFDFDDKETIVIPREAWIQFATPVGIIKLGHQASHWGLGMLANSGADGANAGRLDVFNERTQGDLVERLVFATRPGRAANPKKGSFLDRLVVGLGGDLVYKDENADLLAGDTAVQGVFILALRPDVALETQPLTHNDWEIGAYSVVRHQTDDDGDELFIGAVDLFWRIQGALQMGSQVIGTTLAMESVGVFGRTDRVNTEGGREGVDVRTFGLATEVIFEIPSPHILVGLRGGLATGDANADDGTVFRFTMDPDYKAGLILFDHVLAETSAYSYDRVADPARSGFPPKGADLLPSKGSLTNVGFANVLAIYNPVEDLRLALGFLYAASNTPLTDPVDTFSNGGEPTGPLGAKSPQASLGFETDVMLEYNFHITDWLTLQARAEYGLFLFGAAFATQDGRRPDPIHYGAARVGLYF